eukprot:TRINITY_DN2119_c0_g1::TRINITY_DN2119_c0_g1_i1::g.12707::m.12707 TRINITY_DN2119_c0_g1::TRINITY_DN2119_c0_g1_i1::g.12707  ORF type:complete len:601 (-),score=124.42,sp/Q940G0/TMN1_ARATH/59.47/0.0,EMP70/PF02990.11/5.7e-161,EVC2_like/PF12297.3/3.2,EVC2_like/PF12297.3/1.1e+02 TRINITY_DN2119_c0_g1_i1:69-1838(-)
MSQKLVLLLALFALCSQFCFCKEENHNYNDGDPVTVYVNVVGPYYNPQETYGYYSLPFCRTERHHKSKEHKNGLGEVLEGNDLRDSGIEIQFKKNRDTEILCETHELTEHEAKEFRHAIRQHYWAQLYVDDLPMWGRIGEIVKDENGGDDVYNVYTHKKFDLSYNQNNVIEVNLTHENPTPVKAGAKLVFTYSASWKETTTTFTERFNRYLDYDFFEHRIHLFSIFNSFMMVIFLTGLVSLILMRTLSRDYAKYAREDDEFDSLERAVSDDSGWKQVHGDVFRPPRHLALLCAVVGTGAQLASLLLIVILIAMTETLYIERGTIITVFIGCYAVTALVGGLVSGSMYARNEGKNWIRTMWLTSIIFPGGCCGSAFMLNFIAMWYHSTIDIPFTAMMLMVVLWTFAVLPLTLVGTLLGRNFFGEPSNPCRINTIPRPIPQNPWYLSPTFVIPVSGLLPFGSIFIETYFVFAAFWNYKFYYVYGFLIVVFVILTIVTVCVTIVGTYFLLNAEDYRWPWTSFLSAASTAMYIFLYAVYYYHVKTRMSGLLQTVFYFGYMGLFSFGIALLCGAVGHLGASVFVKRIYQHIKSD